MTLKDARKKADLFRTQVSRKTGINANLLAMYENGDRDINGAKLLTLLKLCDALDCNLEDIITDDETLDLLKKVKNKNK